MSTGPDSYPEAYISIFASSPALNSHSEEDTGPSGDLMGLSCGALLPDFIARQPARVVSNYLRYLHNICVCLANLVWSHADTCRMKSLHDGICCCLHGSCHPKGDDWKITEWAKPGFSLVITQGPRPQRVRA